MKTFFLSLALFAAINLRAQWQAFTPNIPDTVGINALDAVDEQIAWALAVKYGVDSAGYQFLGHDKGYFFRTADGGATWSGGTVPMGVAPYFTCVSGLGANTAWVSGLDFNDYSNHVRYTNDGGQTWTPSLAGGFTQPGSFINFIHFWDAQNGMACGDPTGTATDTTLHFEIWTTSDGGQNWSRVPAANIPPSLPDEYGYAGSFSASGQYIWFSAFSYSATPPPARVFRSADKGLHWEVFETGLPDLSFFSFADASLGAAGTYNYTTGGLEFQITQDGGATWTDVTLADNQHFPASFTIVPGSGFLVLVHFDNPVSGPFTTLVSKDLGQSWQQIGTGEIAGWAAFAGPTAGYAGEWQPNDHATRMYKYTGSPLSGLFSGQTLEAKINLAPNPASDVLRVSVQVQEAGDFWVLLNDTQGHLLKKEIVSKVSEFEKTLEIKNLPAGTYTLTVSNAKGSLTRQFVKQ